MSQAVVERKNVAPAPEHRAIEISNTSGGGTLLPRTFGDLIAFANVMAGSQHAIPAHLRGNVGACIAVTMQAMRWEADPFSVAAKSYNVKDQIAYEAQLIAAIVHTRAPIRRSPDYSFDGTGPNLRCTISVEMKDGSTKGYTSPKVGEITTKNSPLWKTDPEQQLGYYSIRAWARRYAPEVLLGIYSRDEIEESQPIRDVTPQKSDLRTRLEARDAADPGGFTTAAIDEVLAEAEDIPPGSAAPSFDWPKYAADVESDWRKAIDRASLNADWAEVKERLSNEEAPVEIRNQLATAHAQRERELAGTKAR